MIDNLRLLAAERRGFLSSCGTRLFRTPPTIGFASFMFLLLDAAIAVRAAESDLPAPKAELAAPVSGTSAFTSRRPSSLIPKSRWRILRTDSVRWQQRPRAVELKIGCRFPR